MQLANRYHDCVNDAVQKGKLTRAHATQILESSDPMATVRTLTEEMLSARRMTAISAVRLAENFQAVVDHPDGMYAGLQSLMVKDPFQRAKNTNVEARQKFYQGKFDAMFVEPLSKFRTRMIGFSQDTEAIENTVKAVYGEPSTAEAANFAKSWVEVAETARQLFNRVGGAISKNDNWLLPQSHDMDLVHNAGFEKWSGFIRDLLDPSKMLDDTGKALTKAEVDDSLQYVFDTISTGGVNKMADFTSRPNLTSTLARKGAEHRFLYFKDADSWMQYNKAFGRGDIYKSLVSWLDEKANDIALMEVMGPNPATMFDALKNQVDKEVRLTGKQKTFSSAVFNVVSGRTSEGDLTGLSKAFVATKNTVYSALLGSAFLSSVSDVGTIAITTKMNNIPTFKALSRQMSLLRPTNEADRIFAVRLGLIAEAWKGAALGSNRFGEIVGTGITAKVAEGVMRGSFLASWTDAGRKAFGMEFAAMLADNVGKQFDDLHPMLKKSMENYNLDAAKWDTFRARPLLTHEGASFADVLQDPSGDIHRMIITEMDYAVPTPDARVRAMTTGGHGNKTVKGMFFRSVFMLKSFPITMATTHLYRIAAQSTTRDKVFYAGALGASTTVMGGIALHAKDIASGREPRPMDGKFLGAAALQGGALGIFGDFIFSDVNRFGGGPAATFMGPLGGLVDDTLRLTKGSTTQALTGEDTAFGARGADFAKRYLPDIWQTRLFTDALFDNLAIMSDPKAQRRFNRIVRKRQQEFGQGYWTEPTEIPFIGGN